MPAAVRLWSVRLERLTVYGVTAAQEMDPVLTDAKALLGIIDDVDLVRVRQRRRFVAGFAFAQLRLRRRRSDPRQSWLHADGRSACDFGCPSRAVILLLAM
jgi:hypothetical protein